MSPAEKWNTFAEYADPIIALMLLFAGIGFIASLKKLAISRQARVDRGDMSQEESAGNEKLVRFESYILAACGAFLVVMWLLDL